MFYVLDENNTTVFVADTFMEAANKAIALGKETKKGYGVSQEIWNTLMLLEEEEIIEGMVEVA